MNRNTGASGQKLVVAIAMMLMFVAAAGDAQWTRTGTTVHPTTITDNVGVGTTTPAENLQVFGATVFGGVGSSYGANRFVIGAAHGDYGIVGYNTKPTTTSLTYQYYGADSASQIYFFDGGFRFRGAGVGTTGTTIAFSEFFTILKNGNVGVGTVNPTAKLQVVGDIDVSGNIAAKYQDLAEWVPSTQDLEIGTVVVLDPSHSNHVMPSERSYDTRVAGIVSDKPGVLLGEAGVDKEKIATTGRVRVKVDATKRPIRIGDILVSSSVKGMAMVSEPLQLGDTAIHRPGTIIGKALEPLESGRGEILVLLSLQ